MDVVVKPLTGKLVFGVACASSGGGNFPVFTILCPHGHPMDSKHSVGGTSSVDTLTVSCSLPECSATFNMAVGRYKGLQVRIGPAITVYAGTGMDNSSHSMFRQWIAYWLGYGVEEVEVSVACSG